MNNSFWDLIKGGGTITSDERAIEAIRRCSTVDTFKDVLARLGVVIDYARATHPKKELIINGTFTLEKDELNYLGVKSRIVKIDLSIENEVRHIVLKSHFYLIVSFSGQVIGVLNVL